MDHLHLVYEDELLKLFWDTAARYHIAEWRGAARGEKLRTAAYACVNASRTRPSPCWLADASKPEVGMLEKADQQWMVEDFYPRLSRNGVKHVAFVTLQEIPVRHMNKAFGEKSAMEFQYCSTRAEAAAWLASRVK
jgi:hypothetical protein